MIPSIIGAAVLTAILMGVGYLVAKFANAFSSFDPLYARQIVAVDHLKRPIKWETDDERSDRLYAHFFAEFDRQEAKVTA